MKRGRTQNVKKQLLLLIACGLVFWCNAQHPKEQGVLKPRTPVRTGPTRPPVQMFTLKVQGNHDFYLTVNQTKYGKMRREEIRSIPLNERVHRLVFEEADSTGEKIEHYFRVTKEMIRRRDTLYKLDFKNDYLEIIQPGRASISGNPGRQ